MLKTLNETYSKNTKLIWGTVIHTLLISVALIVAYNSYKEFGSAIYGKYFLMRDTRAAIRATFPLATVIFATIYIIYSIVSNKKSAILTVRQYAIIFICQAAITTVIFISKGTHVIIVLNFSLFYLALFLLLWSSINKLLNIEQTVTTDKFTADFLPPVSHRLLRNNMPRARSYFVEKPSVCFLIVFASMLLVSTLLSSLGQERAAGDLATIAYFALVAAVAMETYRFNRCKIE